MAQLRRVARSFWARALISAGFLVAIATQVDFSAGVEQLSHAEWGWFVLAVAVVMAALGKVLRAYMIGVFTTNFLPSQVGGDAARIWIVSGPGTRTRAATTVVADRVIALGCLLLVAWMALAVDPGPVPRSLTAALGIVMTCSPPELTG